MVLGELLAISALIMCLLFILVDMGRPDRFLHIMPFLGTPNWPRSLLAWDALVLNVYLAVNLVLVSYLLFKTYRGRGATTSGSSSRSCCSPSRSSISTHTVTAFLYNGMAARPYWNASILAPRFIASAFCSGPAVMIILFQVLRRTNRLDIKDEAIWKIAELMAYAMFLNLFLLGAELFKEYYSATEHLLYTQYLWTGIGEHRTLVPYAWFSLVLQRRRVRALPHPADAAELRHAEPRLPPHLGGRLHREGDGAHHPRHDAGHARADLRVPADRRRVGGRGRASSGSASSSSRLLVKIAVPILVGTFRAPERAGAGRAGHAGRARDATSRTAVPTRKEGTHEADPVRPRRRSRSPAPPPRGGRRRPLREACAAATARTARAPPVGQKMGAKDLTATKESEAALANVIANGKGKMTAYKGKLTDAEIQSLAKYVKGGLK